MYAYGLSTVTIIDATKYDRLAEMILSTVTLPSNITRATGAYCPENLKMYIGGSTGVMYVVS
jgi:hypothetical protein